MPGINLLSLLLEAKKLNKRLASNLTTLKSEFRRGLAKEIIAYIEGKISHTSLISRTATKFRSAYRRAYELGLESSVRRRVYKLTNQDLAWLREALQQELRYWNKFMRDIKNDNLRMTLTQRLEMYVNTLESIFTAGKVKGSSEMSIVSWIFGEAEHCLECVLLEQLSPFTKETLPTTPRSGDTRCLANCKCKLVIKRVPMHIYTAIQKRQKTKQYYLSLLNHSRKKKA